MRFSMARLLRSVWLSPLAELAEAGKGPVRLPFGDDLLHQPLADIFNRRQPEPDPLRLDGEGALGVVDIRQQQLQTISLQAAI